MVSRNSPSISGAIPFATEVFLLSLRSLSLDTLVSFADSLDAEVYNAEVIARAIVDGLVRADNSNDGQWNQG
ncbi:hypothetical protein [Clostridium beijerinckii]|uniref:Uncharacterized protein n=1 Tax=Clostridium beijerinckii TaxID=1520 RepID=A0A9Q5CZX4_CLOBE|nr:hypothetical protein CLBIJ_29860 [Clostridium beijerinckii]MBA2884943.1 hypothetical protein [Clostridium beijerinckii]MBA2899683.1 hypothetical protein [Clostridium beijerinckii]MBA2909294.1 hypothetical protein [Clostridium beijerinckii]MBA9014867.1 hypothetical protein [Clostridium beijerinckii]